MNFSSRWFAAVSLCFYFFAIGTNAHAQTASAMDGAIVGNITDSSDAAIPNVSVTLSGAAVMGDKKITTDANGAYRFLALTPGDYRITYEASGFGMQTRDGVHVSLGFTATVNVQMAVGTVSENITVNSETSAIDLQSNDVTTDLEAPALASLPGARDLWAVLSMTPAVAETKMDVGGSDALTQQSYTVYGLGTSGGGGGGINRGEVEGMMVNEGSGGGGSDMFYADYGAMQTISVNAANNTAEMPQPGVLSDMVAKTGGNEFHGNFYFDYENGGMEWHNINAAQIATLTAGGVVPTTAVPLVDVNRLNLFRDLSANVGGYIIKNKLWWFASYRYTVTSQNYPTLNESQISWSPNYTGKVTYNLTNKMRLVGFYTHSNKYQPDYLNAMVLSGGRQGGALETGPTAWNSSYPVYVWDGEYIYDITPSVEFQLQGGNYFSGWTRLGKSSDPRIEDTGSDYVSGGQSNTENDRHRGQGRGSISYIHSGWFGTHNFKFGTEYMRDTNYTPWNSLGTPGALDPSVPCPLQIGGVLGTMCQTVSVLNNGSSLDAYFYAEGPYTANFGNSTVGIYGNDTWQINRRLTVNVGLRFDRQNLFNQPETGPNGTTFGSTSYFTFHNFGPRVGISYDLSGKGTSVVKASFGHYFNYPAADYASSFNPDSTGWYYEYLWSPTTASSAPGATTNCPGPLNLGDTANSFYQPGQCLGTEVNSSGGAATTKFASNLKLANTYQASAYYEQQLGSFTLRTGFVFNHVIDIAGAVNENRPLNAYTNPINIYVPNAANQYASTDPQLTVYDINSSYLSLPNINIYENLPENSSYYNWEFTATKQSRDHHFTLLGSFNYTWLRTPNLGTGSTFTPNQFINTLGCSDTGSTPCTGGDKAYYNWQGKIDSQVLLPFGFKLSPILRLQAGTPFARTFTTKAASVVPGQSESSLLLSYTIQAEPYGAERTPTQVLFDIRTEKEFTIKERVTATGFFDVYNIFNNNAITAVTVTSGSAFLLPSNITAPRVMRVGVKLGF